MPKPQRSDDDDDEESGYLVTSHGAGPPESVSENPQIEKKKPGKKGDKADLKPRQTHVARACVNCQKGHVACGVDRPCQRCIKLGKTATCKDVEQKKRGWRKGRSRLSQRKKPRNPEEETTNTTNDKGETMGQSGSEEDHDHDHDHDHDDHELDHDHGHDHDHEGHNHLHARQGIRWSGSTELDQDSSTSSSISPIREPPLRPDPPLLQDSRHHMYHPHPHPHPPLLYHPQPQPQPHHHYPVQAFPLSTTPSPSLSLNTISSAVTSPFDVLQSQNPPPPQMAYPSNQAAHPFFESQTFGRYQHPHQLHRPPFNPAPGTSYPPLLPAASSSAIITPTPTPPPLSTSRMTAPAPAPAPAPIAFDESRFFFMVLGLNATVLDCHEVTCSVLGYSKGEFLRKSFFDWLHPADIEIIQKVFQAAVKLPQKTEFNVLFRIRPKRGEHIWIGAKGWLESLPGSPQPVITLSGGLYHEE